MYSSSNCNTAYTATGIPTVTLIDQSPDKKMLKLDTNNALQRFYFCIRAQTDAYQKLSKVTDKIFSVMVCGYETISAIPDTLKFVKYKDTGLHDLLDLVPVFTSNTALCPVTVWILKEQYLGVMREFTGQAYINLNTKRLLTRTDYAMEHTLFIEALSSAPVKKLKEVIVKVCGNEIIRPTTDMPEYVYLLGSGSNSEQQAFEATSMFAVDDPDCPFQGVVISKGNGPLYSTHVGSDVYLTSGVGILKYVTVSTKNLMDKTTFGVKANTVTPAN